ncbi:MAG: LrgB family protein [Pseudobutyrivibrio sp.]|nr:LrgB family protein [Pseudobutyrivibrio sp.]
MAEFFKESAYIAVAVSLIAYSFGSWLKRKFKLGLLNPLLISILCTIAFLLAVKVDYETYKGGAQVLTWFLTPATVSLAIPLYEEWELLKANVKAVVFGILSGVITSLVTILVLSVLLGLNHKQYVTLLPKSITVAMGMGLSEELGGYVIITVSVIAITGVLGNVFGEAICKLFRIKEPIAKGLAFGTATHAIGTARAMEIGEVEGAMSGLSIAVAGVFTVILAPIFATFF